MSVFEFGDYKKFTLDLLASRPKGGRGEFLRIAKALNVHTTMITHVFRGDSDLNTEQALALADYFGLSELETEFFVELVQSARASTQRSKLFSQKKLQAIRERATNVGRRLDFKNKLSEKDQAIFYSSWRYAAVRLLTAVPGMNNPVPISKALGLTSAQVNSTLEFLTTRGLVKNEHGKLSYGDVKTYASRDSQFAFRHSLNWHLKAIEQLEKVSPTEIAFSNAVVISESDFQKISEQIISFIEQFQKTATPSPSEILCCLNIDWLRLTQK